MRHPEWVRLGRLRHLDQVAEAKWLDHEQERAPRLAARRAQREARLSNSRTAKRLAALDRTVLDRRYSDRWLLAASAVGVVLLAVMIIGMVVGDNGIPFAEPELGLALLVLPLLELWRRRRVARGQQPPMTRLARLDERLLKRKR